MSVSRVEQIFRTRDLLDNPLPNRPSFHQLLRQEISTEMDILNKTSNSSRPWALSVYQLNYIPNQDTYAINVNDFGKVMYVERVQGDPWIRYVNVPFSDVHDLDYGTVWQYGSESFGVTPWITETPERMSFYRDGVLNSQCMVRIQPEPQTSWTYLIHYMPGILSNDDPLASAVQLPEHATLAQLRNAASLLPYTSWSDNKDEDDKQRQRIGTGLQYQLSIKEPLFDEYVKSIAIPKPVFLEEWNS